MGRGGVRYGAGRPGWRRKCENSLALDLRILRRRGRLAAGQSFPWSWSRDGEPCGSIAVSVLEHSIRLSYVWTGPGDERVSRAYEMALERTPCPFGGARIWFRCRWCGRRCAVIYGLSGDGYFGCRRCLRLAYACEAEDLCGRLWRKQRKLEARLADNLERPKGMRVRTYQRIVAEWEEVEEAKDLDFAIAAARLLGIGS